MFSVTYSAVANASWTYFRMEQMQKRLPDIMLQKPDTDGEGGGGGGSEANPDSGANPESEANPDEAAEANYDVDRNEDADVEPSDGGDGVSDAGP